MSVPHLLATHDLSVESIHTLLDDASSFLQPNGLVPTVFRDCTGKRVILAFFEPSTRTRLSFETAAERLGASAIFFQTSGSSVEKGESMRETIETIQAMSFDALVIRHAENGIMQQISSFASIPVINAGEGSWQHPTQALLDASTIREKFGSIEGVRVAIVGDLAHSRVARSTSDVLTRLGAEVRTCAPKLLAPTDGALASLPAMESINDCLDWANVVYLLRIQQERLSENTSINIEQYRSMYAMTEEYARMYPNVAIMHPGPVNEGVELDSRVLYAPNTLIHRQVSHGVAVRMAVLRSILIH